MPEAAENHSTFLTRRTLLSRGAVALPAVALAALPVAAAASAPAACPGDAAADAELLSLFDRWIAQERVIEAMAPVADEDAFTAACDVADALMRDMAALPAGGLTGLAAKAYLLAHIRYGGTRACILTIALPGQGDGGGCSTCDVLQRSVLADALHRLPVLARA